MKSQHFRVGDESFRKKMLKPPKTHTRASALASSFVNEHTAKAVASAEPAPSLFKMKKFQLVEPRTSSKNPRYRPTKREGMDNIATRPNPVFGAK